MNMEKKLAAVSNSQERYTEFLEFCLKNNVITVAEVRQALNLPVDESHKKTLGSYNMSL